MKLLPEFALIHDIFDGPPGEVRSAINDLQKSLLEYGLVRNLRAGDWERALETHAEGLPFEVRLIVQKLLRVLNSRKRLLPEKSSSLAAPEDAAAWCREALERHRKTAKIDAIIAGEATAQAHPEKPVCFLSEILDAETGFRPSESITVRQTTDEYLRHLQGVLTHAGRVCFIDPFLGEPKDYSEFPKIVLAMSNRSPQPAIEIHRAQKYEGIELRKESEWRVKFRGWDEQFCASRQRVKVFIWGKFHNRYLLSNLVSLQVGWGFRTSKDVSAVDHWTRLSRKDGCDLDGKFGENSTNQLACLVCPPFYIGAK